MIHEIRIVSQAGPGGDNSFATCNCDWWGRPRLTRTEAAHDGRDHLKACLEAILRDAIIDEMGA